MEDKRRSNIKFRWTVILALLMTTGCAIGHVGDKTSWIIGFGKVEKGQSIESRIVPDIRILGK